MEEAFEWKREKYDSLVSDCQRRGWKVLTCGGRVQRHCGTVSVKAYTALDITGERRRKAIHNNIETAEKASRWLSIERANQWLNAAGAQAEAS